ncbi:MAG: hypothetical protein HYZ53_08145 [Planctomycetes bacterium]|nr:hypothetical protein [Planctomycetota bacterium]
MWVTVELSNPDRTCRGEAMLGLLVGLAAAALVCVAAVVAVAARAANRGTDTIARPVEDAKPVATSTDRPKNRPNTVVNEGPGATAPAMDAATSPSVPPLPAGEDEAVDEGGLSVNEDLDRLFDGPGAAAGGRAKPRSPFAPSAGAPALVPSPSPAGVLPDFASGNAPLSLAGLVDAGANDESRRLSLLDDLNGTPSGATAGLLHVGPAAAAEPPAAPASSSLVSLGNFRPSFYWIAHEADFSGPATTAIYDPHGALLGRYPAAFVRSLRLEGTGKLRDGRVLNVAGNGRFTFVDAPYGLGAQGIHLVPFRSVAVDRSVVRLGTRLYVPAARGILLPDGSRHDGIFEAHDVGSAIRGRRIDVFIGRRTYQAAWESGGLRNMVATPTYRVRQ